MFASEFMNFCVEANRLRDDAAFVKSYLPLSIGLICLSSGVVQSVPLILPMCTNLMQFRNACMHCLLVHINMDLNFANKIYNSL